MASALLNQLRAELDPRSAALLATQADLADCLIANTAALSDGTLALVEAALEPRGPGHAPSSPLRATVAGTELLVVRGDITALRVDAIVNAANAAGLGCFQVDHRCLDNVIHRAAGPRLREACRAQLRGRDLACGTAPIVTPGFLLPARSVIHVTGPQCAPGTTVASAAEEAQLRAAYEAVLNACVAHQLRSVALNCLSTGIFCFPAEQACLIALGAVRSWIAAHPGALDRVVFDVFTASDDQLYRTHFPRVFVAPQWLREADRVLIVAGAGMSAYLDGSPCNVYVDREHFAHWYPDMPAKGFRTAYECMGLADSDLAPNERWGFSARHMRNMRWDFAPCEGYGLLARLVAGKDVFVMTSNVDGCFARAGFAPERIYEPQGNWEWFQCLQPCSRDSVWPSKPMLDALTVREDGSLPPDQVPVCRNCGGPVFGNVRGGAWFLETPYVQQRAAFREWLSRGPCTVLELGCGFNTPGVTRFPAESIASNGGRLIRINPMHPDVPHNPVDGLYFVGIKRGWDVLREWVQ